MYPGCLAHVVSGMSVSLPIDAYPTYMYLQINIHKYILRKYIYINKYTSAKIGALRAPHLFLLGCVKRRSYMLIHVLRTTTPWLKTGGRPVLMTVNELTPYTHWVWSAAFTNPNQQWCTLR